MEINGTQVEATPAERKAELEELLRRSGVTVKKNTVEVVKGVCLSVRIPVQSTDR